MTYNSEQKLYKSRQWLKRMYEVEGYSTVEIGKMCGVSHQAIRWWLERFGVKRRKRGWGGGVKQKAQIRLSLGLYKSLKKLSKKTGMPITRIQEIATLEYMTRRGYKPFKEN